jgi:type I restriction enzyme, R subunit
MAATNRTRRPAGRNRTFLYQSTGVETRFTNGLDPEPRSRRVFAFHRPATLAAWAKECGDSPPGGLRRVAEPGTGYGSASLRGRMHHMPPLQAPNLWDVQRRAVFGTTAWKTPPASLIRTS